MTTAYADPVNITTRNAATVSGSARDLNATALNTAAAPRLDLYAPIHKALRGAMTETLALVGRLDVFDAEEMQTTLQQFEALLDLCVSHIEHEEAFIHPAIRARQPAAARRTADAHVEHLQSIEALRDEGRGLQAAGDSERSALALRLYRHLALFVAENFQHMQIEETSNNAALWASYSDAELSALHGRLLASISPREHLEVLRWMVPALSPTERAAMLNGAKAGMPPEAFLGVIEYVRPHVDPRGWAKLAGAVGIALQPGRLETA
jgi:hypothetical protein